MSTELKPTTFYVTGNCQAQYLASAFSSVPGCSAIAVGRRFGFDPMVGDLKPIYCDPKVFPTRLRESRDAGQRVVLLEQVTPVAALRDMSDIDDVELAAHVRFPNAQSGALWPGKILPDDLIDTKPGRVLSMDLAGMRQAQKKADFPIDIAGFVKSEFVRQPLFLTYNHPTGVLLAEIMKGILQQLGDVVSESERSRLVTLLAASAGIDNINHHPVDPARAEALGFDWQNDAVYQSWWAAQNAWKAKDHDATLAAVDDGLRIQPRHPYLLNLKSHTLAALGRVEEAVEPAYAAKTHLPHSIGMARHLVTVLLSASKPIKAKWAAEDAIDHFPTEMSCYVSLATVLLNQNNNDAAIAAIDEGFEKGRQDPAAALQGLKLLTKFGLTEPARDLKARAVARMPKNEALAAFEV